MYMDTVVAASIVTVLAMLVGSVWMGVYTYRHVRADEEAANRQAAEDKRG